MDTNATSVSTITIGDVFQEAIANELKVRDLYLQYSHLFDFNHFASDFWKDLAADENKHAHELKEAYNLLTPEQKDQSPEKVVQDGMYKVRQQITTIFLRPVNNLFDAYHIAHELEAGELNYIFKIMISSSESSVMKIQDIIDGIDKHQNKLADFRSKFHDRQAMEIIEANGF